MAHSVDHILFYRLCVEWCVRLRFLWNSGILWHFWHSLNHCHEICRHFYKLAVAEKQQQKFSWFKRNNWWKGLKSFALGTTGVSLCWFGQHLWCKFWLMMSTIRSPFSLVDPGSACLSQCDLESHESACQIASYFIQWLQLSAWVWWTDRQTILRWHLLQ